MKTSHKTARTHNFFLLLVSSILISSALGGRYVRAVQLVKMDDFLFERKDSDHISTSTRQTLPTLERQENNKSFRK